MVNPPYPTRARSLDDVLTILEACDHAGEEGIEAMTSLDHQLQCASVLQEQYPDDRELQLAGLLHDIGHRLAPGHPESHGVLGGEYVRDLLGERIGSLIELHVDAKRYLVSVEPEYRRQLSPGSAQTLIAQGEAMGEAEAAAFSAKPHATGAVALRRADEAAKLPGRIVPALERWLPVLEAAVVAR
ncbi:MAG: HD domain-containing protein [Acidimicrobiaceae bacterium]|nr:HD domain-containing protein [Acidimicrobiaceae bacterium]